jgi:hypothetical protein
MIATKTPWQIGSMDIEDRAFAPATAGFNAGEKMLSKSVSTYQGEHPPLSLKYKTPDAMQGFGVKQG